jgi:Protein of unknown function (DUF5672)
MILVLVCVYVVGFFQGRITKVQFTENAPLIHRFNATTSTRETSAKCVENGASSSIHDFATENENNDASTATKQMESIDNVNYSPTTVEQNNDDTSILTSTTTGDKHWRIRQYSYTNPWIVQNGCTITVAILDPSLGPSVYVTLESVAENVHPNKETCILIQTSLCRIQREYKLMEDSSSYDTAFNILTESIYNTSKPLLRQLIELGNVRVSIFNHIKYQTSSCSDFRSVNAPFFNIDFWSDYYYLDTEGNKVTFTNKNSNTDITMTTGPEEYPQLTLDNTNRSVAVIGEFLAEQDSDFLLVIQNDAVLCHGLDVYSWNHFAYVGAPWGAGYFCNKFPRHWTSWHQNANNNKNASVQPLIPNYPRDMCTNPDTAPLGNGGLTLRSRHWMRQVIRYCPQVKHSGLSEQEINDAACRHTDIRYDSQEDVYYGVLLRGIFFNSTVYNTSNYAMPTILEASLFATESRYFTDHCNEFPFCTQPDEESMIKKLWWSGANVSRDLKITTLSHHDGWDRYQQMKSIWNESNLTNPIVPIGYHAIHKYGASRIGTAYHHIVQYCPHIAGITPKNFKIPPLPISNNNSAT